MSNQKVNIRSSALWLELGHNIMIRVVQSTFSKVGWVTIVTSTISSDPTSPFFSPHTLSTKHPCQKEGFTLTLLHHHSSYIIYYYIPKGHTFVENFWTTNLKDQSCIKFFFLHSVGPWGCVIEDKRSMLHFFDPIKDFSFVMGFSN